VKDPGPYRWRECLVLAAVPLSVSLGWITAQFDLTQWLGDRWYLAWGVGAYYAVTVLALLAWYRSLSVPRTLSAIILSILAWHWAVQLASDGYQGGPSENGFVPRSVVAGFFGAVIVGISPLAGRDFPRWERRLAILGLVGAVCGAQMALLCLWNFAIGFWLGLIGWQLAVTAVLIYSSAPQRNGQPVFWPSPPQLG